MTPMTKDLVAQAQELRALIEKAQTILVASHLNPDGDNLGSSVALIDYIQDLWPGKDLAFLGNDSVPETFSFLPHLDLRKRPEDLEVPDLALALDSSDLDRLGPGGRALFEKAAKTVNIDHHASNEGFADLDILDRGATSTGEVLFEVLQALDYDPRPQAATALYAAISSDTGSFQYDSVKAKTHRNIGRLLDLGADFYMVTQRLYQSRSKAQMDLFIRVLSRMTYHKEDQVAFTYVLNKDFKETGAKRSDTEGLVELLRNIDSVELAVLLIERPGDKDAKFSLRSKNHIDCTRIAERFGGGGHVRASGGNLSGDMDQAREDLLKVVSEVVDEGNTPSK